MIKTLIQHRERKLRQCIRDAVAWYLFGKYTSNRFEEMKKSVKEAIAEEFRDIKGFRLSEAFHDDGAIELRGAVAFNDGCCYIMRVGGLKGVDTKRVDMSDFLMKRGSGGIGRRARLRT